MKLISRTIVYYDEYEESGHLHAKVLFSSTAEYLNLSTEEIEEQAFQLAEIFWPHYSGPGRSFVEKPSYHFEDLTMCISQRFGMDI